jgi:MOSC domain-containing protein YiiM/ferredoxin-NADP reductase
MSNSSDDGSTASVTSWDRQVLLQVRTGQIKPVFGPGIKSAIYKSSIEGPVQITKLGCVGDEHAYSGHGGPDKAFLWYNADHYVCWNSELPGKEVDFKPGAFGENLVTSSITEHDICIGDAIRIGKEVVIAVAEPRQPCYMLNHRFKIKDMSKRSQDTLRTGWYCRVLQEGSIQAGDEIFLISRPNPEWPVSRVQHYLYRDMKNHEAMQKLSLLEHLGKEIRDLFSNRLRKQEEDQELRLQGDEEAFKDPWSEYVVTGKTYETQRILSVIFEAKETVEDPMVALPGSHVRLKLGGDLVRAYSVVGGDENRFELGIALSETSRGGSEFIHSKLKSGDALSVSRIATTFPLNALADRHIFIAGGIGLTAFIAAAKECQEKARPYHLHYLVRDSTDVAFKHYLNQFGDNVTIHDRSIGKRCDIVAIMRKANSLTHVYCCGSEKLMEDVKKTGIACGLNVENLHFEAFATTTSGDPFTASLIDSGKEIKVAGRQTLLDVLRDVGLEVPSSCEVGNCGTCRVKVKCGRVEHRGTGLMDWEKDDTILACVSRGIGNIELEI